VCWPGQCLDRRIESIEQLATETNIWERQRNAAGARIKWMFTAEKARAKMGRAYPQPQASLGPRQRIPSAELRANPVIGRDHPLLEIVQSAEPNPKNLIFAPESS
jgi:hypothetical protein